MEVLSKFLANATTAGIIKAVVVIVVGLALARILGRLMEKSLTEKFDRHKGLVARKVTTYLILLAMLLVVLSTFGISLSALLAATGLFTVALGFAAQASISNIVSGFFLLMERPFQVDDFIEVDGTIGTVVSLDMISTKLKTFDNLFIRIPNETILKSTVKTFTKYDVRMLNIEFGIAYEESIARTKEVVGNFLKSHPMVLEDPAPVAYTMGLGESSVKMLARFWINRVNYIEAIDQINHGIKDALDDAGIEIPYPHRVIHFEAAGKP